MLLFIKTVHFNPCASFSLGSGIAPTLLLSQEELRVDPKKQRNYIICDRKERSTTQPETTCFGIKQNGSICSKH